MWASALRPVASPSRRGTQRQKRRWSPQAKRGPKKQGRSRAFVEGKVSSGEYASGDEVVAESLRLMETGERKVARLRELIAESDADRRRDGSTRRSCVISEGGRGSCVGQPAERRPGAGDDWGFGCRFGDWCVGVG